MTNRREFLKSMAGATAGILFTGCELLEAAAPSRQAPASAAQRRAVVVGGRRIATVDVHCHCYIHDVYDLVKDFEQARPIRTLLDTPEGQKLNLATVEDRLQQMDQAGIDIQALSMGTPYLYYWAERDLARRLMKIQNEKIAELCAAHPDRFVGMTAVSLQYPDLAAEQIEEGVRKLGMRGCTVAANVNGEELSSPRFHPFWAKAEELGCLVFLHPAGFQEAARRFQGNGQLSNIIGNPLDTTVALSHLIWEGTLDRFPGLKICAAHGGGFLPAGIGRADHCAAFNTDHCKPPRKHPSEYLKQLYFDSLVFRPDALRFLVSAAGASQVVLGTDYPYVMGNLDAVNHILDTPGWSDDDRRAILGDTAARLLRIRG